MGGGVLETQATDSLKPSAGGDTSHFYHTPVSKPVTKPVHTQGQGNQEGNSVLSAKSCVDAAENLPRRLESH